VLDPLHPPRGHAYRAIHGKTCDWRTTVIETAA
jgi:hypothetical protein